MKRYRFWGVMIIIILISLGPLFSAAIGYHALSLRALLLYICAAGAIIVLNILNFKSFRIGCGIAENEAAVPRRAKVFVWIGTCITAASIILLSGFMQID